MNEKEYIKKLEDENLLIFSRVHHLEEVTNLQANMIIRFEEVLRKSLAFHRHAIDKNVNAYDVFVKDESTDQDFIKMFTLRKHLDTIYESSKVDDKPAVLSDSFKACEEIIDRITKEFIK